MWIDQLRYFAEIADLSNRGVPNRFVYCNRHEPTQALIFFMDPAIIWFLIGLGLIIAELAVLGIILVFFGIAAWVVAILDWCGVESLSVQLWIFGITSLLLVFVLRRFVKDWFLGSQLTAEGNVHEEFVGKIVTVLEAIEPGDFGKVELKGANWKAFSDTPLAVGDKAEVIARDNITLKVEPLD